MSSVSIASDAFFRPGKAFDELRVAPTFWLPLLLLTLASTALVAAYFLHVDLAWFNDQLVANEPQLQKLSRTQAIPMMSRAALLGTSVVSVLFVIPLMRLAEACFYSLAGKLADAQASFGRWMALACWSSLPLLLPVVVSLGALALDRNGQLMQEQLDLLSLNQLVFQLAPGHKAYTLANTLTIVHPWAWALGVIGVHRLTRRSWTFAVAIGLLPWLAVYGAWLAISLA